MKNVVVAIDGSDHAKKAVELATDVAAKFGATLHLVHVVHDLQVPEALKHYAEVEHIDNPAAVQLRLVGERVLKQAEAQATRNGVAKVSTVILMGEAAEEILSYARYVGADIIFTGRRGLSRMVGLLIGSVSSKVSSLADCPVVTVK